jgi:hypothetical protein
MPYKVRVILLFSTMAVITTSRAVSSINNKHTGGRAGIG